MHSHNQIGAQHKIYSINQHAQDTTALHATVFYLENIHLHVIDIK